MSDILAKIMAYKREEVARRRAHISLAEMEKRALAAPPCRGFAKALSAMAQTQRPALIGEIKKASPSKGLIREDFDPAGLAQAYEEGGAACLSVLTDGPSFQGADAHLEAARGRVGLPILRKDFICDAYQIAESRAIGADCILLILAALSDEDAARFLASARDLGLDALVEVHDEAEMARANALNAPLIGINNRSLRSFETRLEVFERLAPLARSGCFLVAESGIISPRDLARLAKAGARAYLVGESLMRAGDVRAATQALLDADEFAKFLRAT